MFWAYENESLPRVSPLANLDSVHNSSCGFKLAPRPEFIQWSQSRTRFSSSLFAIFNHTPKPVMKQLPSTFYALSSSVSQLTHDLSSSSAGPGPAIGRVGILGRRVYQFSAAGWIWSILEISCGRSNSIITIDVRPVCGLSHSHRRGGFHGSFFW